MAEAKTTKTKTKQVTLKNKKAVKQTLAKASIKGQTTKKTAKKSAKTSTVKVKIPSNIKRPEPVKVEEIFNNIEKVEKEETKKKRVVKTPNNIIRKLTPPGKVKKTTEVKKTKKTEVDEKEIILENFKEEKKEQPEIKVKEEKEEVKEVKKEKVLTDKDKKRLEKKKIREEKKKKRKEAKQKRKEAKKKEKEKKLKEKKRLKEEKKKKKSKIELPKEWKSINTKNTKGNKVEKAKEEAPKTFKGKLKSSIFESVDEKELEERKRQSRESLKKTVIVLLIIAIAVGVAVYSLLKYNSYVRKQLAVYEPYRIGDKVRLKDGSIWYVVKDSDSKEEDIRILAGFLVDINDDGIINSDDLVPYNTENIPDYDTNNENSVANLLNGTIKDRYSKNFGKIEEMSLLTSKEFVKIRERMNFGDQWENDNWLAHPELQKWWIQSEQNNKVYIVSKSGTFYLSSPNTPHYVRAAITIKKEIATKIEEKRTITVDLINGLKIK